MILHPLKVEAKDDNIYLITFSSEKGELQFPFQVEEGQIDDSSFPIASWDVSFSIATVGEDRDFADELLQAIHCLNKAREFDSGINTVSLENRKDQTRRYRVTIGKDEGQSDVFVEVSNGAARGSLSTICIDATEPLIKMIERFDHSISLSERAGTGEGITLL